MRAAALLAALAIAPSAFAANVQCYENPRTNAMQCVAPTEVRERDGIRFSPLYMGGPNNIRKTSFTIHTNCKTGVTHLKDADGVSFAGGYGSETKALETLRGVVCTAPIKGKR